MAPFPKISPEAVRLLDALLERSNVNGGELMRRVGFEPQDLVTYAKELQKENLIQVSGDTSRVDSIPFATFGIQPSSKEYIRLVAQQSR